MTQQLTGTPPPAPERARVAQPAWLARAARSVLNLDSLVYAFGSWTIGFLVALAFGLGWYFALAFALATGVAVVLFARRFPIPHIDTSAERADSIPVAIIAATVLAWPIALDLGRTVVVVAALALVALRVFIPAVRRALDARDARLLALCAIAALAALAFWWSWTAFVVVLCIVAVATLARPDWSRWFSASDDADAVPRWTRFESASASNLILGGLGALIGVWHVGGSFYWNSDNTYYLNKAAHYGASPTSFPIRDYMFGFSNATHYPFGDILSAFEPALGVTSRLTGISITTLLFQLVVPLAMVLVPFAARYAARGLGLRRGNLIGAFAAAATLLMTGTEAPVLFAQASLGRTIGRLVFIPILIGAVAYLLRRKDPGSSLRATLACVCAVGASPSLTFASALIVAPFTAAALWDLRPARTEGTQSRLPRLVCVTVPLVFIGAYALVAHFMQDSAGSSQFLLGPIYRTPLAAWRFTTGVSDKYALTVLFVAGAVAVFPLVLGSNRTRRAGALLIVLVFGIVFAPWSFEPLVDHLLDLSYFAARFLWALPLGLVIGVALANMDARKTIGLLTIAAATLGLGLSGPDDLPQLRLFPVAADVRRAPPEWPWNAGIPAPQRRAADAVFAATPAGGRFLAPPFVEEVATATQIHRFPVYARAHYVSAVGRADSVPAGFFVEDRELLSRGMSGSAQPLPARRWRAALERVGVDTVCIDPRTVAGLRQAVTQAYVDRGPAGMCEVWTRR